MILLRSNSWSKWEKELVSFKINQDKNENNIISEKENLNTHIVR